MCMQTNPELRARMIRETVGEIREWVRTWLPGLIVVCRKTVTATIASNRIYRFFLRINFRRDGIA